MESYCRGCEDRGTEICPQPSLKEKLSEHFNLAAFCLAMAEPGCTSMVALDAAYKTSQQAKSARQIRQENIAACVQIHQAIDVLTTGE